MKIRLSESEFHLLVENCVRNVLNEMSPRPLKSLEDFIQQAVAKHNNKYDYSKVVYKGTDIPVIIVCPQHGDFSQTPHKHLQGEGCPICQDSHLETATGIELGKLCTPYIHKHHIGKQHLDYYLPYYNAGIECQGIQHYEPIWGQSRLDKQIEYDRMKRDYCEKHNIRLFEITYKEEKIVAQKVKEIIDVLSNGNQ